MNQSESLHGNTRTVALGLRSARNLLLPGERLEDFQELLQAYVGELQPTSEAEFLSVVRVVGLRWKLQRADLHEDRLLAVELEKQVETLPEKKAAALVARALQLTRALEEMLPFFRSAGAKNSEQSMRRGVDALVAMVSPLGALFEVPPGLNAGLQRTLDEIGRHYAGFGHSEEPDGVEDASAFEELISNLRVMIASMKEALTSLEVTAREALEKRTQELRFTVRLKVAEVRVIDRYRTALERGIQRELEHLQGLRAGRQQAEALFGTGMPASLPTIEVKLVQ